MGSSDSTCCGSHTGQVKTDFASTTDSKQLKHQRNKQGKTPTYRDTDPLLNGDTTTKSGEFGKKESKTGDINEDDARLKRVIKVMKKFNEWLEENEFVETKKTGKNKKLRELDPQSTNYKIYHKTMEKLICSSVDYYSTKFFLSDASYIKQYYHYRYAEVREIINQSINKGSRKRKNDNSWCMKHYFLRNKEKLEKGQEYNRLNDPLEILTNLYVFLFHSVYISEFKIQSVHPRDSYITATYIERKVRKLNIKIYQKEESNKKGKKTFPIEIKMMHLIAIYYGGKYMEDDDILDKVSPLAVSEFIEKTMNKATLAKVWTKLDEDGSNTIDKDEVDGILLLTVILLVATEHKDSGVTGKPRIDKSELKELMRPISEWMKEYKMVEQPVITKDEFRETFSKWLKEYHETNGGYIADPQEQLKMLKKYKINDEKNGLLDGFRSRKNQNEDEYDRLVINCEYLKEHISSIDVNSKDDDDDDDESPSMINPSSSSGGTSLNPDAKSFAPYGQ